MGQDSLGLTFEDWFDLTDDGAVYRCFGRRRCTAVLNDDDHIIDEINDDWEETEVYALTKEGLRNLLELAADGYDVDGLLLSLHIDAMRFDDEHPTT